MLFFHISRHSPRSKLILLGENERQGIIPSFRNSTVNETRIQTFSEVTEELT